LDGGASSDSSSGSSAQSNFSIGQIPAQLAIDQGGSAAIQFTTVSTTPTISLQFSVNSLPSGITASVAPNPAPPKLNEL
jgi:hypothetical protein